MAGGGEGGKGGEALVAGIGVDGQPLEGQDLGLRKQVDGGVLSQPAEELVVEAAGVLWPGCDDQQGGAGPPGQSRYERRPGALPHGGGGAHAGGCLVDAAAELRVPLHQFQNATERHLTIRGV